MGNLVCRRKSKSVVVLTDINSLYINKIYEIIKPEEIPADIERNYRGELSRGIQTFGRVKEDIFSQLLVEVFNGKEPLSIMKYLPLRNLQIVDSVDLSSTRESRDTKNIFFGQRIGGGTYGSIHLSKYFPDPIFPELCVAKKTEYKDDQTYNSFIEEMLTSILLHESKERMPGIPQVFPKIIGCYHINDGLVMLMEKLDISLFDFLTGYNRPTLKEKIDILIIIAHYIEWLQTNFFFIHRDLHAGNIMLKKEPISIEIRGKTIKTKYRPYFIDFGMACVDLSKCCALNNMCVDNRIYNKQDIYCLNKSHDLRQLLFSLIDEGSEGPSDIDLYHEYKSYFYPYREQGINLYYQDVLGKDDSNFYPENVIKKLLTLI